MATSRNQVVAVQTSVEFEPYVHDDMKCARYNADNQLTRTITYRDEIDGKYYVKVFTDDGKSNGDLLFQFALD